MLRYCNAINFKICYTVCVKRLIPAARRRKGEQQMKRYGKVFALVLAAALLPTLAACSSQSSMPQTAAASMAPAASSAAAYEGAGEYEYAAKDMAAEITIPDSEAADAGGGTTAMPVTMDPTRKLIRTVTLEIETKEYDALTKTLMEQISLSGGYIEDSRMVGGAYAPGGGYDDYYYGASNGSRYAQVTARIPSAKVDGFIAALGEQGVIRSRQESTQDVTLNYVDTESRKKSLEVEYERLLALLEKADKLEAIVQLEQRLSDVRYEIESYGSQLRTYDNRVEYATVHVSITEVQRVSAVPEPKQTLGQRMSQGLSDTMYRLSRGGQDFLVWLVVNLPYLIIWAVVIAAIWLFIRRLVKKQMSGEKKEKSSGWKKLKEAVLYNDTPAEPEQDGAK